jgi:hypothetical protein
VGWFMSSQMPSYPIDWTSQSNPYLNANQIHNPGKLR